MDEVPFGPGDTLLLRTDGVAEARDRQGVFYPFAERTARWAGCPPGALLDHVHRDPLAHTGGRLGGDVALVAIGVRDGPVTGAGRFPGQAGDRDGPVTGTGR
ncbi:SpoIIE family protein phosphatase [Streptomyces sp. NPDC018610]|uniref:SpoIIE family protein phosphatase n=1 Tax=Streptomyces sp. NPDC018610 TaxID=3365049 RepID=UPI0037A37097